MKSLSSRLLLVYLVTAVCTEAIAATVTGKIIYTGSSTGQIYIAACTDSTFRTKQTASAQLGSPGNYTIEGLSDGIYYLGAIMMTDSTGPIKITDPWGAYAASGKLTPVVITGGSSVSGIDITIVDGTINKPNPFYTKPATPKVTTQLPEITRAGKNASVTSNGGSVYMFKHDYQNAPSGKIFKINPYTGELITTYILSLESSPNGISWIGAMTFFKGEIWATGGYGDPSGAGGTVGLFKVDPSTSKSSNQIPAGSGINSVDELGGLTNDGVNFYVGVDLSNLQQSHGVVKFDPGKVSEVPASPFFQFDSKPWHLSYGDDCLWVGVDSVKKINPANGTILANYFIPGSAAQLYLDEMFWMYDQNDNTLKAYDLEVTGVSNAISILPPSNFYLFQNYPNPFNPSTTISYAIPARSRVVLSVYNTLGQKVTELVNSDKEAGEYNVRFDAGGLASGLYLYRIQAGGFVQTRTLVVLK